MMMVDIVLRQTEDGGERKLATRQRMLQPSGCSVDGRRDKEGG